MLLFRWRTLAVERFHATVKPFNSTLALTNSRMWCVTGFIWTLPGFICDWYGFIYSEYDEQLERCLDPWTLEKASSVQWLFVMQLVLYFPFSCSLFYCYFQIMAERNIHQQNRLFSRNCIFNAVECKGKAKTCLDFLSCRSFLPLMLSAIFGVWTLHLFSTLSGNFG